jgi:hypothetical protein
MSFQLLSVEGYLSDNKLHGNIQKYIANYASVEAKQFKEQGYSSDNKIQGNNKNIWLAMLTVEGYLSDNKMQGNILMVRHLWTHTIACISVRQKNTKKYDQPCNCRPISKYIEV